MHATKRFYRVTLLAIPALALAGAAQAVPVSLATVEGGGGTGYYASWRNIDSDPYANVNEAELRDSSTDSVLRGDAFDDALRLQVDGSDYDDADNTFDLTGQTVTFGSDSLSGLDVSLEYLFSPDLAVARIFSTFTNPSGSSINATVSSASNLGSDGSGIVTVSSSGDGIWTTTDGWFVTDEAGSQNGGDPAIVFVTQGPGVVSSPVTSIGSQPSSGNVVWSHSLDVPAGETVHLLWFVELALSASEAETNAARYDSLTGSEDLFSGLTSTQLADTVNWVVAVPEPQPALLLLGGLAALAAARRRDAPAPGTG